MDGELVGYYLTKNTMAKVKETQKLIQFLEDRLNEDDFQIAAKLVLKVCEEYSDHEIEKQINYYCEN